MSKNNKNQKWRELIDDITGVADALILLGSLYAWMIKLALGKSNPYIKSNTPAENPLCKKSEKLLNLYVEIRRLEDAFNDFNGDYVTKRKARGRFKRQKNKIIELLDKYRSEGMKIPDALTDRIKGSKISSIEAGWFNEIIESIEQI